MGPNPRNRREPDPQPRIRKVVQDAIINGRCRWTARDLAREVAGKEACPRSQVKSVIRSLIEDGLLEYRYSFGQSYLALSFRRPVDLTPRFTIIPADGDRDIPPPRIPVVIAPGIAFGDGRHPTTRLALHALDRFWTRWRHWNLSVSPVAADIGTGSGILAIAAACLGAATVMALDIDACARAEAQHNVRLNPKAVGVVHVLDLSPASIEGQFDLIMANLRLPTLAGLADWVQSRLNPLGCMVVSGCRHAEWGRLAAIYAQKGLHPLWQNTIGGWAGGLFGREDP